MAEAHLSPVEEAWNTVRRLVGAGGCAWHAAQTHESLTKFLAEEAAEFADAVDRDLPVDTQREELGDVLYQVLVHAAIAERDGEGYELSSLAAALDAKLRARHPHVFGDRGYLSAEELEREWERLKEDAAGAEPGSRGVLDGIPRGLPPLARAAKMVDRMRRASITIDEKNLRPDAVPGEGGSPAVEGRIVPAGDGMVSGADAEWELGRELFESVRRAQARGIDPDRALRRVLAAVEAQVVEAGSPES